MITDIDEIKFVADPFNRRKKVIVQPHGDEAVFKNSINHEREVKDRITNNVLTKTQWWASRSKGMRQDFYPDYESDIIARAKVRQQNKR